MRNLALLFWLLAAAPAAAQTWGHAHGGADGAGFADVATRVITSDSPKTSVSGLGAFAPGAGPVIDAGGVAYLGTIDGQLIAVKADGTRAGTAQLPPGRRILTSPVIGADGSIYVAASMGGRLPANDHRATRAWLYRFSPQLAQIWERPLPIIVHESGVAVALNTLSSGTSDLVMIAAAEGFSAGGYSVKLDGFSAAGLLLFSQTVGGMPNPTVTSEGDWTWLNCVAFRVNTCFGTVAVATGRPPGERLPLSAHDSSIGLAIAADRTIVVTDGHNGVRGYSFSPAHGLSKAFEKIDARQVTSAPAILTSRRSVYAVQGSANSGDPRPARIAFSGPSSEHVADIFQSDDPQNLSTSYPVEAPAAQLASGRVVTVDDNGFMTVIDNVTPVAHIDVQAQTIAGASASRTVIYVSTVTSLLSFDASNFKQLGLYPWSGGGESSPAIGGDGTVYALAGDTLTIFKVGAPRRAPASPTHVQIQRPD
jgi:outer membrane protein assembly factor BamB